MKLRGSSLLESLIALVILITVLGISFNSVLVSSSAEKNTLLCKAKYTLEQFERECIQRKNYKIDYLEEDGIEYDINISFVNRYKGVIKIKSVARLENKTLLETVRYINTTND